MSPGAIPSWVTEKIIFPTKHLTGFRENKNVGWPTSSVADEARFGGSSGGWRRRFSAGYLSDAVCVQTESFEAHASSPFFGPWESPHRLVTVGGSCEGSGGGGIPGAG